jgi:hypothetical protein
MLIAPIFMVVALVLMWGVRRGEAMDQSDTVPMPDSISKKIEVPD